MTVLPDLSIQVCLKTHILSLSLSLSLSYFFYFFSIPAERLDGAGDQDAGVVVKRAFGSAAAVTLHKEATRHRGHVVRVPAVVAKTLALVKKTTMMVMVTRWFRSRSSSCPPTSFFDFLVFCKNLQVELAGGARKFRLAILVQGCVVLVQQQK